MKFLLSVLVAVTLAFATLTFPNFKSMAQRAAPPKIDTSQLRQTFERLIEKAEHDGSVRVIVGLNSRFTKEGDLGVSEQLDQRLRIRNAQESFISRARFIGEGSLKRFEYIP